MPAINAAGKPPLADETRLAIDVGQHRLEHLGPLHQARFQRRPFGVIDQQRHVAERPRPVGARRVLVDAIEHAGIVQVAVGGGKPAIDFVGSRAPRAWQAAAASGRAAALRIHHFVERAGQRPVARQQLLDAAEFVRRAVEMGCHAAYCGSTARRRSSVIGYSIERSSGGS